MSFGKSRARLLGEDQVNITFADVAGAGGGSQARSRRNRRFLERSRQVPETSGGKIPKGVLMVGSPGTGKTLLARAIAGEANVPFFTISGSDFVEMFVGVGASRVRDMFECPAKKHAPCIIFIDEIDAVGGHRGAGWAAATMSASKLESAAGGDGRLRGQRRHHCHRRARPIDPMCSIRRCCARVVSTARSSSRCPMCAAASKSSKSICARCRSATTSSFLLGHRARNAGLLRCRPRELGERSGAVRGAR